MSAASIDALVIDALATENADLRIQLAESDATGEAWRQTALATLDAFHKSTDRRRQLVALAADRLPQEAPLAAAITAATSLREMAAAAIHYAATVTQDHDRTRASYHRLLDEHRKHNRRAEAA